MWPHLAGRITSQHPPCPPALCLSSLSLLLSPVQLLSSLTECLTVDPLSASVWRQLYPKHLSQSRQVGVGEGHLLSDAYREALIHAPQSAPGLETKEEHLTLFFRFMPPVEWQQHWGCL